jgi:hypothetical protein
VAKGREQTANILCLRQTSVGHIAPTSQLTLLLSKSQGYFPSFTVPSYDGGKVHASYQLPFMRLCIVPLLTYASSPPKSPSVFPSIHPPTDSTWLPKFRRALLSPSYIIKKQEMNLAQNRSRSLAIPRQAAYFWPFRIIVGFVDGHCYVVLIS